MSDGVHDVSVGSLDRVSPQKKADSRGIIAGVVHLEQRGRIPVLSTIEEQEGSSIQEVLSGKVQSTYEQTEHAVSSDIQAVELEADSVASRSPGPLLPAVAVLVEDFSKRPFGEISFHSQKTDKLKKAPKTVLGYQSTALEEHQDEELLKNIVEAHNLQFSGKISAVTTHNNDGYIEKLLLPVGAEVCVRSDLHGDLASLLAQLKMLQAMGKLDEKFHCVGNFKLIFLGDNTDKGANDIEVVTLLLKLRMENPSSIFLIRGNHEDVRINVKNSMRANFFVENESAMTACYTSFPLALCVAAQEQYTRASGDKQRQFVHFSHGLFSPAVNTADFLAGEEQLLAVPHSSVFPACAEDAAEKAKRAFAHMRELFEGKAEIQGRKGYSETEILSDVHEGEVSKNILVEGKRFLLSPHTISLWLDTTGTTAKVKMIIRGHQHASAQFSRRTKRGQRVFLKTLAVGSASGPMAKFRQPEQALLCTVASKVSDWSQRQVRMRESSGSQLPVFELSEKSQSLSPLIVQ